VLSKGSDTIISILLTSPHNIVSKRSVLLPSKQEKFYFFFLSSCIAIENDEVLGGNLDKLD